MLRRTKLALSALMSFAFMGGVAHADGWTPVKLSYSQSSQSYQIAADYYKKFLTSDPTIRMKTKTINLQTDNVPNPVGSIVVKFISADTCSELSAENCLTTILKYDMTAQKWTEVWEHHTKVLYLGGPLYESVVNKQEGAYYHTLYTTDGLQWDWENLSGTFYQPTPIGDKFISFSDQYKEEKTPDEIVDYLSQQYGWPKDVPYYSQRLDIDNVTNKPAYIVSPTYGPNCGQDGCDSVLLLADPEGGPYKSMINKGGTFSYSEQGWIVKGSGRYNGYKDIIIRVGTQLEGYSYSKMLNRYALANTTYPSSSNPAP